MSPICAQQKEMVRRMRGAFPDMQLTVQDVVAEGDKVVTCYTATGTHQGEWRWGTQPTGQPED